MASWYKTQGVGEAASCTSIQAWSVPSPRAREWRGRATGESASVWSTQGRVRDGESPSVSRTRGRVRGDESPSVLSTRGRVRGGESPSVLSTRGRVRGGESPSAETTRVESTRWQVDKGEPRSWNHAYT